MPWEKSDGIIVPLICLDVKPSINTSDVCWTTIAYQAILIIAKWLSFSIAQSAQSFMENDAITLSDPPAAASTLDSIRAESSSVEPLPRERARDERGRKKGV
jgi:hypothetical protein